MHGSMLFQRVWFNANRREWFDAGTTSQCTSTAFFAGTKNFRFLTPPMLNEHSPCKSSSVYVESGGIARSLLFVRFISSRESKFRGASKHPQEEVFHFDSRETIISSSYDTNLLHHLYEYLLFLSTVPLFWFSLDSSYDHEFQLSKWFGMLHKI